MERFAYNRELSLSVRTPPSGCMHVQGMRATGHVQEKQQDCKREVIDCNTMASDCCGPRCVTVSALDSESSDHGSNPREAFGCVCLQFCNGCNAARGKADRNCVQTPRLVPTLRARKKLPTLGDCNSNDCSNCNPDIRACQRDLRSMVLCPLQFRPGAESRLWR